MTLEVHKFGGTSLQDADRIGRAAARIPSDPAVVVVSALGGVTDALIGALRAAASRDGSAAAAIDELAARHARCADELLGRDAPGYLMDVRPEFDDVKAMLRAVEIARSCPEETVELVSGYGELWSARLMAAKLGCPWLDARDVLVVEHGPAGVGVDWTLSAERLERWRQPHGDPERFVVTGYIARQRDGAPTTLKRNGSDLTASIFGRLCSAASVTIWTDVDGVLSADPRRVPEAVVLSRLSYEEAMELAYFGAKVLHPHTIQPAVEQQIPILIRNSGSDAVGTEIGPERRHAERVAAGGTVRGLSSADDVALLNVEGAGMIGVPGIASRMFSALREQGVSVVMISQASSEHSICVAVPETEAERAAEALRDAFASELHHGQIERVELTSPCSIIAAVGDSMAHVPGVAARFFGALGAAGVSVVAVAQGSSERNISAVVRAEDSTKALRAVHGAFYLAERTLAVGLIGPGLIGSELLRQIEAQAEWLRERFSIQLQVRALASSQQMLLADSGSLGVDDVCRMRDSGVATDLSAFVEHVQAPHLPHAVIVDCTASDAVAAHYGAWLERGVHVVTPNKKAGAGDWSSYVGLVEAGRKSGAQFLYEATVGAGLPVITTLRDLIHTGDRCQSIEGILSGTLSHLFGAFDGVQSFSQLVHDARERGFTEPDPREDLSGMDVARKAVILAREQGVELKLEDVEVENLVPATLNDVSVAEFVDRLAEHDAEFESRRAAASERGEVLRYVAVISPTGARVGLRSYPQTHPFASVVGGDNVVAFTTDRYREHPLIVRGPGAGPAVTAGGVFADMLRLVSVLGGVGA